MSEERGSGKEAVEPGIGGGGAPSEKLLQVREVVQELLRHLGVEAEVEVRDQAESIACKVEVRAGGEVLEALPIGQVMGALESLVNRMINRGPEGRKAIELRLGEFPPADLDPEMEAMALRLKDSAQRMGKRLTLVPMQARDRRSIHRALAEVEGVQTRSEGEGNLRRLVILGEEPE